MMTQSKSAPFSFDKLMIHTCDVLLPNGENPETGYALDDYGQSAFSLDVLATGAKCRATTLRTGGREKEANEKYALNDWVIFLRPVVTDDLGNKFNLSPRHWLRVYLPQRSMLMNLKMVNDPSGLGHHLEARGTEILTTDGVSS